MQTQVEWVKVFGNINIAMLVSLIDTINEF